MENETIINAINETENSEPKKRRGRPKKIDNTAEIEKTISERRKENEKTVAGLVDLINHVLTAKVSEPYKQVLTLQPDEKQTLVKASIPVIEKYDVFNFEQSPEIGLVLAIGSIVIPRLFVLNELRKQKKIEVEREKQRNEKTERKKEHEIISAD